MTLIPNEPPERLPEELYDELEASDTADNIDDEVEYLLSNTNLTVEEAEAVVNEYLADRYEQQ